MSVHYKKAVMGFKVSPMIKKEVEQIAARHQVDVSTYLRALFTRDHPRLKYLSVYPEALLLKDHQLQEATSILVDLQEHHPAYSSDQLLLAALRALKVNEENFIKVFHIKKLAQ